MSTKTAAQLLYVAALFSCYEKAQNTIIILVYLHSVFAGKDKLLTINTTAFRCVKLLLSYMFDDDFLAKRLLLMDRKRYTGIVARRLTTKQGKSGTECPLHRHHSMAKDPL